MATLVAPPEAFLFCSMKTTHTSTHQQDSHAVVKAIETQYKGYRFRSRLEARWAVFFDELKMKWEYEREGYELPGGRYLPDFFVQWGRQRDARLLQFREVGYWVEIKGAEPTDDELKKLSELSRGTGHIAYLLSGSPWDFRCWVAGIDGDAREWTRYQGAPWEAGDLVFTALVGYCCPDKCPSRFAVVAAAEAARGARFEFGESGARA